MCYMTSENKNAIQNLHYVKSTWFSDKYMYFVKLGATKFPIVMILHYDDVRMGAIASQITSLMIVYSIVYSDVEKTSKLRVTGLCVGNSPGTGELPAQMASYAENVSFWWRHHGYFWRLVSAMALYSGLLWVCLYPWRECQAFAPAQTVQSMMCANDKVP